jgi:hypothetical protein
LRSVHALTGLVAGHPSIVNGRRALTSQVYAFDAERGFARTASRFFRLGRPFALSDGRLQ